MIKKQNIFSFLNRTKRFGLLLPLTNIILIYFSKYISSKTVKIISDWRHRKIEDEIIKITGAIEPKENKLNNYEDYSIAPIWFCWIQGEDNMPEIPKLCLEKLRKYSNQHPVIIITYNNFLEYVELPDYILDLYRKGKITNAHFSDILRMNLIFQNGGFWMDATMLLTEPIDEDIFKKEFYTIKIKEFGNFVSRCRWNGFCIAGHKNNILTSYVVEIFNKYWEKETCLIDYFLIDYAIDIAYKKDIRVRNIIDNIEYSNLNLHKLSSIINYKYDSNLYSILTEETSMFKLNWKMYKSNELINNNDNFFNHIKENG